MHPDDIQYTASTVTTDFGLYEFVVMPMGGRQSTNVDSVYSASGRLMGPRHTPVPHVHCTPCSH